jgi:cyclophilin family peptidyl-prolyl cis-trans isomerase
MEAVNALGQMGSPFDLSSVLEKENDDAVRGLLYETIGRLPQADEKILVQGLQEPGLAARTGAAKGLESYFRRTNASPHDATIIALRKAVQGDSSPKLRKLALLTMNTAGDADRDTLAPALADADPQVRRLAVMGLKAWKEDSSHLVRYESLRVAGNCQRAEEALGDPSEHVVLLAIEQLGNGCPTEPLEKIADQGKNWRTQSRALVSLANVKPGAARKRLPRFVEHPVWQARAYAGQAAKILGDQTALQRLLQDSHPNVVASALVEPADAVEALKSSDYGLLMVALGLLKAWPDGSTAVPDLLATLRRVSAERRATSRDPRRQILERLREFGDENVVTELRFLLIDFDPVIAKLAAEIISEKTGNKAVPVTRRLATEPVPSESFLRSLEGAKARIQMKAAGPFTLGLIPEEAPVTVATFVRLAEQGYYDGLTFHRIVPNFVIQGGSPGANEYVGTADYLRDELGLLSHARGTVGISTRGRDTGDGQIFINLVDNFRLDHNYTVFARVVDGMENVDRIQEDDVIESIAISRKRP